MRSTKVVIFVLCSMFIPGFAVAQDTIVKKDTTHLYKNIEKLSKRGKFSTFIYTLIFKSTTPKPPQKKAKKRVYKKLIQKPYSAFEGKIIRRINIETLDPFGYSITDTAVKAQNFFASTGNKLHVKSRHITIRNLLLVHQNQVFDSLLVKESERLVRTRGYIHDVSFFVKAASKKSDSVDIFIRELDKWTIVPYFDISTSSVTLDLKDNNFLGLGHESEDGFTWYRDTHYAYHVNYFIPNFKNTYVNATMLYNIDEFGNYTKSIAADRPFFSPFAKWAGGINLKQQFAKNYIRVTDSVFLLQRIKYNQQDYWVGSAIRIFKGNTETDRTTNFIAAVRFLRTHFLEQPIDLPAALYMYSDEKFYMTSLGISTRKYVQDKLIFNFGEVEDVPIGKVFSITGGYQTRNNIGRFYAGARVSQGNYYPWGYLSYDVEYGTFFHASHTEQGTVMAMVNYFTGLLEIGSWKFRQFIKPEVTIGIKRLPYDTLTLNKGYGLEGFNSSYLLGTRRLLLTLQTQVYIPRTFLGFTFGPYLNCSLGMLGNAASGFSHSHVYSQIGIGVLIKNKNLVFNTFQLSISFYPVIPGRGRNILKMNALKTTDFGFRDFEIGKPSITVFE